MIKKVAEKSKKLRKNWKNKKSELFEDNTEENDTEEGSENHDTLGDESGEKKKRSSSVNPSYDRPKGTSWINDGIYFLNK